MLNKVHKTNLVFISFRNNVKLFFDIEIMNNGEMFIEKLFVRPPLSEHKLV